MKLSAVVLTLNEEKDIGECLRSLKFCDEVLVIDSGSTDQTVKIAASLGADIYNHAFVDFSETRNFGLKKSKGDWVLFVDSDERVPDPLKKEIIQTLGRENRYSGFYFKRDDFMMGKWLKHGETSHSRLIRLARKGSGDWRRSVHETWHVKGKVGEFKNPLQHYSHENIEEFVKKINYYSSFDAREHFKNGKKTRLWHLLAYPVGKFIQNYLVRLGFLDSGVGLIFATLMSFNSFLIRAKLWRLQRTHADRN